MVLHTVTKTLRRLAVAAGFLILPWTSLPVMAGDGGSTSVVIVGDTQRTSIWERLALREQNDGLRKAVMRRIAEENPELLVILGDLVSAGDDAEAWRYFDQLTAPVREKGISIVPLLGNHDHIGNAQKMYSAVYLRFPVLAGKPWASVRSHNIAFILLNSNFDDLTADQIHEQNSWYKSQLTMFAEESSVEAIVVCCHHPPFTNSTIVSPSVKVQQTFVPPFLASPKAALFVSGHSYEHFLWQGKHFVVTGGGGGPRQWVKTSADGPQYEDLYTGPGIRDLHFCKLINENGHLWVSMIRLEAGTQNWSVGDMFPVSTLEPSTQK
jgi:3',5'-cyclic AMP phosphodiesterase CpdA